MSPRLDRWVWPRDLGLGVSNSHLCPWGSEYQWPATDTSSSLSPYWQCRCCYSLCLLALNDSVGYVTSVTSADTLSTARPWVLETKTVFSTLLRLLLCQENPQKNSSFLVADWRKHFCSAPERTWRSNCLQWNQLPAKVVSAQSRGVLPPRIDDHVLGRVLWRNLALSRELAWMSPHNLLISRWNNDGGLFFKPRSQGRFTY